MTGIVVEWWATVAWSQIDDDGQTRSYASSRRFGREEDARRWLDAWSPDGVVVSADRLGPFRRETATKET